MYKVFFKDSCFLLTDHRNLLQEDVIQWVHRDFLSTKSFIERMLGLQKEFTALIYHDDLEILFAVFKSCFLYVKAAGGVVQSPSGILVIKRLGMIDLPKGHVEAGETVQECGIREVKEECGLQEVHIVSSLSPTWHIYFRNNNWYLKKTYWYAMVCPPGLPLIPQTEEDIEEVFWLPLDRISEILPYTYPSLRSVFQEAVE